MLSLNNEYHELTGSCETMIIDFLPSRASINVFVILDEAHLIEKETLEEFRFLLNSKFDSVSQMALILYRSGISATRCLIIKIPSGMQNHSERQD